MRQVRDHIGFDPAVWIDRLRYVNETSQFTAKQKALIDVAFAKLANDLSAIAPTHTEPKAST